MAHGRTADRAALQERLRHVAWLGGGSGAGKSTVHNARDVPWFQGEGFALIVEDLLRLPREPPIRVEGFRLRPRLVAPLLTCPAQAVWLLPTPAFHRAVIDGRGGPAWRFLAKTADPPRALDNLLARDALFTAAGRAATARLGLRAFAVDGTMTEGELATRVTRALGL